MEHAADKELDQPLYDALGELGRVMRNGSDADQILYAWEALVKLQHEHNVAEDSFLYSLIDGATQEARFRVTLMLGQMETELKSIEKEAFSAEQRAKIERSLRSMEYTLRRLTKWIDAGGPGPEAVERIVGRRLDDRPYGEEQQ